MSCLFVFHRVSVQGQPAHVGWLHKPEVERGGGDPVQDGLRHRSQSMITSLFSTDLLDYCGFLGSDELD